MNNQLQHDFHKSHFLSLTTIDEDYMIGLSTVLTFFTCLVAYTSILVLLIIVLFTIWKYIGDYNNLTTVLLEEATAAENSRLSPAKAFPVTYGTWKKDIESGNSSNESYNSSSSEDLFDAKICVICYNEQRNCFFVPCGHSATCSYCAQRIFNEESKKCPICRRFIGKIKKLFKD